MLRFTQTLLKLGLLFLSGFKIMASCSCSRTTCSWFQGHDFACHFSLLPLMLRQVLVLLSRLLSWLCETDIFHLGSEPPVVLTPIRQWLLAALYLSESTDLETCLSRRPSWSNSLVFSDKAISHPPTMTIPFIT